MLELTEVSFHYPGKKNMVIQKANINLQPGHIYGLLGKNGVGKSTLFRLISGLNPPTEGVVQTLNYIPFERNPKMMQNLFLVPEDILFPAMTPLKYADLYGKFYKNFSSSDFTSRLNDFEVDPKAKLSAMSQGQKKKAYISFALACNTQILLMDEPTNGLDIPSKTKFRNILSKHIDPDRIIIISTHQVRDLELLIDAVIILDNHHIALCEQAKYLLEQFTFGPIKPDTPESRIVYREETVQGNLGLVLRDSEEPVQALQDFNLETLFNAITSPDSNFYNHYIAK